MVCLWGRCVICFPIQRQEEMQKLQRDDFDKYAWEDIWQNSVWKCAGGENERHFQTTMRFYARQKYADWNNFALQQITEKCMWERKFIFVDLPKVYDKAKRLELWMFCVNIPLKRPQWMYWVVYDGSKACARLKECLENGLTVCSE